MAWATWNGVSSGRAARTQPAAAATIGAANDVPLTAAKPTPLAAPSSSWAAGTPVRIPMPGAVRSTAALSLENAVARSSGPIAPTVTTCGRLAGNSGGLPWLNSLPDAATGIAPALTARWICCSSAVQRVGDP